MADISKIQVPGSATQYNIKDAQARRDIEDVKADLENLAGGGTEQREIQFVYGSYINDGNAAEIGGTVDITNLTTWYSLKHAIVECQEGDEFLIDMAGATNARAWAFLTSNNVLLSRSNENETVTGKITAPHNAGKVIIQGIYRQTSQDTSTDEGTAYKFVQGTGKVVRFDISQDLTDVEKAQARSNIEAVSQAYISEIMNDSQTFAIPYEFFTAIMSLLEDAYYRSGANLTALDSLRDATALYVYDGCIYISRYYSGLDAVKSCRTLIA